MSSAAVPRRKPPCLVDFEELDHDPCSPEGLAELHDAGVALTCSTESDTEDQQCQKIRLDGPKHTGTLNTPSDIHFPALAEFEVHNTLLTDGLPAALVTPQLKLLAFKNNTALRSSLPEQWGVAPSGNASFPALQSLDLENGMWEGSLPPTWGGNVSFPQLVQMIITGPRGYFPIDSGLTGGIPTEWLAPGSFPSLQVRLCSCLCMHETCYRVCSSTTDRISCTCTNIL